MVSSLQVPPTAPTVLPDVGLMRIQDRRTSVPFSLGLGGPFLHRPRNSVTHTHPPSHVNSNPEIARPIQQASTIQNTTTTSDMTTSAAAIRWAGARVSIAPLALPSPEHELTDPMRGLTVTVPGSHPQGREREMGFGGGRSEQVVPLSPNGGRKTRLSSFWQGTQDVEETVTGKVGGSDIGDVDEEEVQIPTHTQQQNHYQQTPTAEYPSPSSSPETAWKSEVKSSSNPASMSTSSIPFLAASLAPATAPVRFSTDTEDDDYFGSIDVNMSMVDSLASLPPPPSSSSTHSNSNLHSNAAQARIEALRQASGPPFPTDLATVPALPRRICLTRQTSAPLPTLAIYERRLKSSARPAGDSIVPSLAGRAAKEEYMFGELGYLAPPNPPDELERRRALYKCDLFLFLLPVWLRVADVLQVQYLEHGP